MTISPRKFLRVVENKLFFPDMYSYILLYYKGLKLFTALEKHREAKKHFQNKFYWVFIIFVIIHGYFSFF